MKKQQKKANTTRGVSEGFKKSKKTELAAAVSRSVKIGMPSVSGSAYSGDGRVRIRHREYVQDVYGSVAYGVTTLAVNPGLGTLFTWLAPIATQFESYLFRNLSFEFETQKGSATVGSIMLAVDYDAADAAPVNKQQLMSYHDSVRSAVWNECRFTCDSRDLQKFGVQRYLRYGALAANQDVKTFDIGNLHIATQGCADATAIGELYVTYDVELITPQTDGVSLVNSSSAKIVGAGTVNLANCYGTVSGTVTGGLPLTAVGGTLTFNKVGSYLVECEATGTVIAAIPTQTGTATVTFVGGYFPASQLGSINVYTVKVNNVGETLILNYTGSATTITASTTRVGGYNYSLG